MGYFKRKKGNTIGQREVDPRLKELFKQGKEVYSISKCNTIDQCLYQAYQSYVLKNKGLSGIYGILGSKIHDCLEAIMNQQASPDCLEPALNEELEEMEMFGLEFPKDFSGGNSIRDNWVADMTHFCRNFVPPKGKFKTEEFVLYKLSDDRYVQGYIDLIRENEDGSLSIYDWKTSANFKAADLTHHGRQLVLYAMAKEVEGYTVRNTAWVMLKYCVAEFYGKRRINSKTKELIKKVINRSKIVKELAPYILDDLLEAGYSKDYIDLMWQENSLDVLPQEIKENYSIKPYVRQYAITEENKAEAINYINEQADKFESLNKKNSLEWKPRHFIRLDKNGKEALDTFFCHNLCNFRQSCVHYLNFQKEWEDKLRVEAEFDDLF